MYNTNDDQYQMYDCVYTYDDQYQLNDYVQSTSPPQAQ